MDDLKSLWENGNSMHKYRCKTCFFLCHGKSIEELELRINEFKDFDVLWGSMSSFDIHDSYTTKAGINLNVVYDCSTVANAKDYELSVRIPRLKKFLNLNQNNHYICNRTGRGNLWQLRQDIYPEFNREYWSQIIYTEDIGVDPTPYCVSLHLYIAIMSLLGIDKIILFGADGGGIHGNNVESYYKSDEVLADKLVAGNVNYNMVGDTNNINSTFASHMFHNLGFIPNVINCSPYSTYTVFRQMNYNETLEYLKNEVPLRNFR